MNFIYLAFVMLAALMSSFSFANKAMPPLMIEDYDLTDVLQYYGYQPKDEASAESSQQTYPFRLFVANDDLTKVAVTFDETAFDKNPNSKIENLKNLVVVFDLSTQQRLSRNRQGQVVRSGTKRVVVDSRIIDMSNQFDGPTEHIHSLDFQTPDLLRIGIKKAKRRKSVGTSTYQYYFDNLNPNSKANEQLDLSKLKKLQSLGVKKIINLRHFGKFTYLAEVHLEPANVFSNSLSLRNFVLFQYNPLRKKVTYWKELPNFLSLGSLSLGEALLNAPFEISGVNYWEKLGFPSHETFRFTYRMGERSNQVDMDIFRKNVKFMVKQPSSKSHHRVLDSDTLEWYDTIDGSLGIYDKSVHHSMEFSEAPAAQSLSLRSVSNGFVGHVRANTQSPLFFLDYNGRGTQLASLHSSSIQNRNGGSAGVTFDTELQRWMVEVIVYNPNALAMDETFRQLNWSQKSYCSQILSSAEKGHDAQHEK